MSVFSILFHLYVLNMCKPKDIFHKAIHNHIWFQVSHNWLFAGMNYKIRIKAFSV